ncbi:MAG: hypothetical protein HQM09_08575 [Candidatus Riflebacteria bacterium]|nr:hypothetical protein [Candidatus Riflebacteria bacterium]
MLTLFPKLSHFLTMTDSPSRRRGTLIATAVIVLTVLLAGPFAPVLSASDVWEAYEINAQYRGGVKQGFQELGCAVAWYNDLSPTEHQIMLHACVKHPKEKNQYYSFRLNMAYTVNKAGCIITRQSEAWFEKFEPDHQEQIKDMVMLMAMTHEGLLPASGNGIIRVGQTDLKINPASLTPGKKQELEVFRPGKTPLEGKFFLKPGTGGKPFAFEKFRFKREKISISFVTVPVLDIQKKYQSMAPFKDVVFGQGTK